MEESYEASRKKSPLATKIQSKIAVGLCLLAVIIMLAAITVFGVARRPVFFTEGKFVQILDTRDPVVIKETLKAKKDHSKEAEEKRNREIQKIAYCIQSLQPKQSLEIAITIAKHTYDECKEKDISIPLWIALMFSESSLDPLKVSSAGAIGLCQVRYSVWKEQPELMENGVLAKNKLFWIDLNIKCATTIFKKYYEESGSKIGVALWRYNSGQKKPPEGKRSYEVDYVSKIMFYAYKATEILAQEDVKLHTVNDPDAQAEIIEQVAAPAPDGKGKPTKKPLVK